MCKKFNTPVKNRLIPLPPSPHSCTQFKVFHGCPIQGMDFFADLAEERHCSKAANHTECHEFLQYFQYGESKNIHQIFLIAINDENLKS